jgi:O-antigen/teichoic acid export membrane protein
MLGRKVALGALWLVGARLAAKGMDLLAMLIVARILTPEDFGLVALAATVLVILYTVSDLSLANALIRMHDPDKHAYDTAFTLNLMRGLVLAGCLVGLAWPMAALYADPRLVDLMLVLALVPLFRAMLSPRMAHLARGLMFRQAFVLEASGKAAAFVASVGVAMATGSYWALIAGLVAAPALSSAISYLLAPYRPAFSLVHWRAIFAFSGWLTASHVVNTLNWHADRFFIGGHLGTAALGQYTVGSELASLPTNAPMLPMMQALYAGFARLADDLERLRTAYLASQSIVMALAVPLGLIVAVLAEPVIVLAIGPRWLDAAFVVQVLAPVIAFQMLTGAAQSATMATGLTRMIFRRDLTALAIRLPLILGGLYLFGFEGVVWARVASGLASIGLNLHMIRRALGAPLTDQLLAPWRSIVSGSLMVLGLLAAMRALPVAGVDHTTLLLHTVALGVAGVGIYVAVHLLLWLAAGRPAGPESRLIRLVRPRTFPV